MFHVKHFSLSALMVRVFPFGDERIEQRFVLFAASFTSVVRLVIQVSRLWIESSVMS